MYRSSRRFYGINYGLGTIIYFQARQSIYNLLPFNLNIFFLSFLDTKLPYLIIAKPQLIRQLANFSNPLLYQILNISIFKIIILI